MSTRSGRKLHVKITIGFAATAAGQHSAMDTSTSAPQQLSRYRSQRRTQHASVDEEVIAEAPEIHEDAPVEDGIARSRSRYHKKTAPTTAARAVGRETSSDTSHTLSQQRSPPDTSERDATTEQYPRPMERIESPYARVGAADTRRVQRDGYDSPEEEEQSPPPPRARNAREAVAPAIPATTATRPVLQSTPSGELFPPPRPSPKKHVDGPPTSDQIRATRSSTMFPQYADDDDDGGCFGLFKRRRSSPMKEKTPTGRTSPSRERQTIRPGGGGIVPGTDAPISAVNAGNRQVLVECGRSRVILAVTPTTTAADLIKSAAGSLSERIDVQSAVLLEDFSTVGVQRPLRRYEHIRDVMNSWNSDKQNSLLLVEPGTGTSEPELSIAGVSKKRPAEASWLLSYSQKVGKWDKRTFTLKADGQLVMQRDTSRAQDENVCHLSDFDIYTPTPDKIRRRIKPPKKHCYAIKSQQKTAMFESTENFVHFFCVNDRGIAEDFHAAVQAWRSWYLVNVMGEGAKKAKSAEVRPGSRGQGVGGQGYAGDSFNSHPQLGSFAPLIDLDRRPSTARSQNGPTGGFVKSAGQFDTTISPERRASTRRKQQTQPPIISNTVLLAEDEPLANLGRRASLNQKRTSLDYTRPTLATINSSGPPSSQPQQESDDPHAPHRNLTTRLKQAHKTSNSELRRERSTRNRNSVDLSRSGSRAKGMPKPLIDLTPEYREPPQHIKKGKGHYPEVVGPGGLVDAATSPEDAIVAPPAVDWRGRNAQHSPNRNAGRQDQRPGTARDASYEAGGAKTRGPLLDMSEESVFAQGSLLKKAEAERRWDEPAGERGR